MAVGTGLLVSLLGFGFILRAVILGNIVRKHTVRNADDVEQPEEIQRLEGNEKSGADDLAQLAFVLFGYPVKLKGANGLHLCEYGVDDPDIDEMAEVDPGTHEDAIKGGDPGVVEIVESLDAGKEPVGDVVGDVDCNTHIGEVEAVGQADEGEGHNMVTDELLEILAGLLHAKKKDNSLLGPVCALEEVVEFEEAVVGLVGEVGVHARGVKVPDGGAAHDVHSQGPQEGEINGGINLLHEPGLLGLVKTSTTGPRPDELLHDELAGKGQDDGVESDKGAV